MKKMLSVILSATMLLSGGACGKGFCAEPMKAESVDESSVDGNNNLVFLIPLVNNNVERKFIYEEARPQETSKKPSKIVSFVKSTLKVLLCAYVSAVGVQILSQKNPQAGQILAKNASFWNNLPEATKQKFSEFLENHPKVKSTFGAAEDDVSTLAA